MQFAYGRQLRKNPLIETYRTQKIMFTVLLVMFFFIASVIVFGYLTSPLTMDSFLQFLDSGSEFISFFLMYPLIYLNTVTQLFYWRWIEQRRYAAVMRPDLWSVAEQPIENPTALSLPYTIISPLLKRPRLRDYAMMVLVILMLALILAPGSSHTLTPWLDRWHGFLAAFAAIVFIFGGLIILILILNRYTRLGRAKIVVAEQGVTMGKTQIYWWEAQLFAIYQTYNGKRPETSITYELSSATDILRWTTVWRAADVQPDSAEVEYTRQLQTLSQMIVARTGLPLVDLRDRPVEG
ncbi:hypothetical protein KDW_46130 [Dictyobacter vulcani]|uniref:Uncharacterized protein n=1 Tax=Dictyobacter vulcani TaxID=2607529 RepID=A0A5J4KVG7_9CHLR|nr:hypothetical protein [Dictyobacter vulcani]GER90451.1 hypothetical protein KDW_46130 [Dictyobacter vulcani]